MGPLPCGPAGLVLNGQPSQSLRVGSRAPTLHCSHPEDNFPLQCRTRGALVVLSMAVTPQEAAPELLSPWLSTEPPRAQPKRSPRRLWSCVGTGSIVEGGLGRKWFAEPEGRKREGVGDAGQSRKMWVLSTRELASHQRILGSAWRGYYPFHSCCRVLWLLGHFQGCYCKVIFARTDLGGKKKYPFSWVCDPWWSLISFVRYLLYPFGYCFK